MCMQLPPPFQPSVLPPHTLGLSPCLLQQIAHCWPQMEEEDRTTLEKTLKEAMQWLDKNQEATKVRRRELAGESLNCRVRMSCECDGPDCEQEAFEGKQAEVEEVARPVMSKAYGSSPSSGGGPEATEPEVEEVE